LINQPKGGNSGIAWFVYILINFPFKKLINIPLIFSQNITNSNSDNVIGKGEAAKLLDDAKDGGDVEEVADTGKVYYVRARL